MKNATRRIVFVAAAFSSVASAAAQAPRDTVMPGTIIRIHVPDSAVFTARLATQLTPSSSSVEYCALTWDPCTADPATNTSRLLSGIHHLDARHTESIVGAILGGAVGTVLGDRAAQGFDNRPVSIVIIGAGLFAGLGAILGSAIPRWVRIF